MLLRWSEPVSYLYPHALVHFLGFIVRGRAVERQRDPEHRPAVGMWLDGDVAAVHVNGPLGNRQAQSGAALLARPCFVDAKEAIEDALPMFGSDAASLIGNGHERVVGVRSNADLN